VPDSWLAHQAFDRGERADVARRHQRLLSGSACLPPAPPGHPTGRHPAALSAGSNASTPTRWRPALMPSLLPTGNSSATTRPPYRSMCQEPRAASGLTLVCLGAALLSAASWHRTARVPQHPRVAAEAHHAACDRSAAAALWHVALEGAAAYQRGLPLRGLHGPAGGSCAIMCWSALAWPLTCGRATPQY
jgi:hypothetical protein